MNFTDAIEADRSGLTEAAANAYESVIVTEPENRAAWLNLMVMYWLVLDPGDISARHLFRVAETRYPALAAAVAARFPASTEVRFWTAYTEWINYGDELTNDACKALLQEDPTELAPVLFLYTHTPDEEYGEQASSLLAAARQDTTARARYVVSVLEAALNRKRAR